MRSVKNNPQRLIVGREGSIRNRVYRIIEDHPGGIDTNKIVEFFEPKQQTQVYNALVVLRSRRAVRVEQAQGIKSGSGALHKRFCYFPKETNCGM